MHLSLAPQHDLAGFGVVDDRERGVFFHQLVQRLPEFDVVLALARRDRKPQRIEMASAIAKQRQHGPDIGRNARYELAQAILVGTVHLAEQFVPDRANIILKGFPT